MTGEGVLRLAVLLTILVMLTSWLPISSPLYVLDDLDERREQIGGGGTLEQQCSSITFEDMFEYSSAIFDITISEDWSSAEVEGVAWVNDSLADVVRDALDEYVASVYPSGDDDWMSTDEREGVRAIASECVEHTMTRIGIRGDSPHRGGVGTSWKNTTWTENQVTVEEWNLVPARHSEIRDCTSLGSSSDCVEVPVFPDENRDCDTDIDASSGADECRLILWLNASLDLNGISGPEQFTIAYNASNTSNIEVRFTFPATPDLRLDMWGECEGRDVSADRDDFAGSAPIRGSCVGDGSSTYELIENEDGSLTYIIVPNMPNWPYGEDIFADFTTAPIPVDDPPEWTESAPADGIRFAELSSGSHVVADWSDISTWFSDEAGVASLDIRCQDGEGDIELNLNSLYVNVPSDGSINIFTCEAVDSANQSSGVRSWEIGIPFSVSTTSYDLLDPHPLTFTPSGGWPDLSIWVILSQPGEDSGSQRSGPHTLGQAEVELGIPSSAMAPGEVLFGFEIEAEGVQTSFASIYLNVRKIGEAPTIVVNSEGWDGDSWSMGGQFSDPDGEVVTFEQYIDGALAGSVAVSGNSWSSPAIDFSVWSEGVHTVVIRGCDESNMCASVERVVDNSHLFDEPEPVEPEPPVNNNPGFSLPAMGLPGLLLAASVALIYSGRRGLRT